MRIRKAFQGTVPENKILDTHSLSQTDTYSCNYVNNQFSWKLLGTTIGTQEISLPNNFEELLAIVYINNNTNLKQTTIIPKIELTNTYCGFSGGYFMAGSDMSAGVRVLAKNDAGKLGYAYSNGNDVISSSTIKWYYR